MTKVTTLEDLLQGKQEEQPKKKPIELLKCINQEEIGFYHAYFVPKEFEQLILISKAKSCEKYDVILGVQGVGTWVFLGHWNDGVVE